MSACSVCGGAGPLYRSAGGAELCAACVGRLAPAAVPERRAGGSLLARATQAWMEIPPEQRALAGVLISSIPSVVHDLVREEGCRAEAWHEGPVRCALDVGHRGPHRGRTLRRDPHEWT